MLFFNNSIKIQIMKKLIFSLAILLCAISLKAIAQCDLTGSYNFTYNSHTYYVVKDLKTWKDAAACAKAAGAYLVEINDTLENIAVYNGIIQGAQVSASYTSVPDGGGTAYVWIGAHDVVEGTWIWDGDNDSIGVNFYNGEGSNGLNNGVVLGNNFANWGNTGNGFNEPDNYAAAQDAAAMALGGWPSGSGFLGSASQWNDLDPNNSLYYVIEKPSSTGISIAVNNNYHLTSLSANNWKLTGPATEPELIELLDSSGRVIRVPMQGLQFKTEALSSGVYLIKIVSSNNNTQFIRFVK